ncbi:MULTISPECIES: hypothetical protein [Aerococcus]|uniref:hypothetical protein n=1 Tax=Aerococcus TaxID=1375 RepID=UPI000DCDFADF|nr:MULTISPECIES: hypothetical protein [Aerococcus]KAA9219174.1 hypothetical protein F6I39_04910 [Aerococcus loyolae]KAA9264213.1 hypothetical protein F6I19_07965 [Aerococcus loyolae]MCY3084071.1 hypothetical protein [Aerococcus mictus]MDK6231526.1 hypothetical protein [Aerococcus urinae]MDK6257524.1 hypothetical protein [Aerococcus urinae]
MTDKDFQLVLWLIFFIATITLIGIAIYKKVKKQPIKPWLIGAAITFFISVALIFIIGNLKFDPDDPLETQSKLVQILEVDADEVTTSNTEYFGEVYKEYNFDDKARIRVNNQETKVLEVFFYDIGDDAVINILNDLNYPITDEFMETLEGDKGFSLNKSGEVGIYLDSNPYNENNLGIIYDSRLYEIHDHFVTRFNIGSLYGDN